MKKFNTLEQEFKLNDKINSKIINSKVPDAIKEFLLKILDIEFREGKGTYYTQSYKEAVEKAAILLAEKK